jgi:hypothetical protein
VAEAEGEEFWEEAVGGEGDLGGAGGTLPLILILEDWVRRRGYLSWELRSTLCSSECSPVVTSRVNQAF